MTDIINTVRKTALPIPLLEKIRTGILSGSGNSRPGHIMDLLMNRLDDFDNLAIRVSSLREYRRYLETVCSKETESITFYVKKSYWERLSSAQNRLDVSIADCIRLVLGTYIFTSGKHTFSLQNLRETFFSERQTYQYNLLLTKPVFEKLSLVERTVLPVNREVILRSAYHYAASGFAGRPEKIDETRYRIDNTTTGWKRITVSGGPVMRNFYLEEKGRIKTSINTIMNHALDSFLTDIQTEGGA
jgi:hypothetical protein